MNAALQWRSMTLLQYQTIYCFGEKAHRTTAKPNKLPLPQRSSLAPPLPLSIDPPSRAPSYLPLTMDAFVSSAGSRTVQAVLILEDYPKPALLLSVSPTSSPQVPSMPGTSDARPEHTAVVASGSEQSMKFGESIPERRPAPSVKDALGHLNLIRWECEYLDNFTWPRQRRSKYNLFLDLMKEYDSQQ